MTTTKKLLILGVVVAMLSALFVFLPGSITGKFLGSVATRVYTPTGKFVTTWKTDNPGKTNANQITIPTNPGINPNTGSKFVYNYTVDWGDGTTDTGVTGDKTHTYATAGTYTVSISGTFPSFHFKDYNSWPDRKTESDSMKLLTVEEWGSNIWQSFEYAFISCENLEIKATDAPNLTAVKSMKHMFESAQKFNQPIGHWNVSNVIDMEGMFQNAIIFNQDLSGWERTTPGDVSTVGNVTNMYYMFWGAFEFNGNIGNWNVGKVTNMGQMFIFAGNFNQDLNGWDVSQVTQMRGMFQSASKFNGNISAWNVSKVNRMDKMFDGASKFNVDISSWNVSNVTDMSDMFQSNTSFSMTNYHRLLELWSSRPVKPNVTLTMPNKYCGVTVSAGRDKLTMPPNNWRIIDGGLDTAQCPMVPTNLRATIQDSGRVELAWDASVAPGSPAITDYIIQYKTATGTWMTYNDGISTSKTAIVSMTFENNIGYNFRVAAKNINETSSYSSASNTVIIDTIAPVVADTFSLPELHNSLTVPVTGFTATDAVGVTGYIITTTIAAPTATTSGWTPTAPTTYTFPAGTTDGAKTLYAWAKDAIGNISLSRNDSVMLDTTAPTVTEFTLPTHVSRYLIPVTTFIVDETNVQYLITASLDIPAVNATGWSATKPTTFSVTSDGAKTLYAWAKDAAGNISVSRSQQITVDTIAPVVTVFTLPSASNTLTDIPVTLTATDAVGVEGYQITSSNVAPSLTSADWKKPAQTTYTFPAGTTDGAHTLYAWAKDAAGQISASRSANVTFDTTAPTILKVTSSKTNGSYKAGEMIPVTVEFSEPVVVTGVPTITLETGTTDALANYTSTSTNTLTFNYTVAAGQNSTDLDVTTLSGVIKDIAGNTAISTLPTTSTHTLAGTKALIIDTTAPIINSFSAPAYSASHSISVSALTIDDAAAQYLITESATPPVASATWTSLPTAPFVYTTSSDGAKTLYAWAKDAAGNISNYFGRPITVDTVAPVVDKFETRTFTNTLEIPITLTATDAVGVEGYQITSSNTAPTLTSTDWKKPAQTTYTFPASTTDGSHTLYAWAKDAAGQISAGKSTTITIDRVAPTITAFSIPATSLSRTVSITTFTPSETIAGTRYLITESNTQPVATAIAWSETLPDTYLATTDGSKTLYAWVKDAAGNISPAFTGRSIMIDATAPIITAFTVPTPVNSLTINTITLTATDAVGITGYMITDSSTAPAVSSTSWVTTGTPTITPPTSYSFPTGTVAGTKRLYAWAKDAAGNISLGSEKNIEIDMTKPVSPPLPTIVPQTGVFEISPTNIETNTTSISFKVMCTSGERVKIHYNLLSEVVSPQPCPAIGYTTLSIPLSTSANYYVLYATTTDPAGNISDTSPTLSLYKNPSATNSAPGIPDLDSLYDSGVSSTDNITREVRPIFTASCIAGYTVTFYDTNTLIGMTTCMGTTAGSTTGTAQFMPTLDLSAGIHTLTAKQKSSTGVVSLVSNDLTVTIETAPLSITLQKSSAQSDPATSNLLRFTATMSTPIVTSSLTCSDITVTNGACTSIASLTHTTYTLNITATTPGTVSITIPAGSVQTLAGNSNQDSTGTNIITYISAEVIPILRSAPTSINGQCALSKFITANPTKTSLNGKTLCTQGTEGVVSYNRLSRKWSYVCRGTNGGSNAICTVSSTNTVLTSAPPESTCDLKSVDELSFDSCTLGTGTGFFKFHSYLSCLDVIAKKKSCTDAGCTQNAPRQELISIAARLRGIPLETGYQCQKKYSDTVKGVPSWVCEVAEKANTAGLISGNNKTFRPLDTMTRAEAFKVILGSICAYPTNTTSNWQNDVAKQAIKLGFSTRTVGTFEPNRLLLKQELYVLSARAAEWLSKNPDSCEELPEELICE